MSPSDIVVYEPLDVFDSIERFRQHMGTVNVRCSTLGITRELMVSGMTMSST